MKLTEINIYPVKSMGCISLKNSLVQRAGLQYDRRWLLMDENGKFMTQRTKQEMALVKFEWGKEEFKLNYKNKEMGTAELPFEIPDSPLETVKVWHDEVAARAVKGVVNEWLSETLKTKCRLVHIEENAVRHNLKGKADIISSFADITPFLIIGESSLIDLNSRMKVPVRMSRFRPNLVFSEGSAFEEDDWLYFSIGNINFKKYKKCGRCVVTTIDQRTGLKMGEEPLYTLNKYRKKEGNLNFGIRAFLEKEQGDGLIKIGDEIIVKERTG